MKNEQIYLAALVHDLGKFIGQLQAAGKEEVNSLLRGTLDNTIFLLKELAQKNEFFARYEEKLLNLLNNLHNPQTPEQRILKLAKQLSTFTEDNQDNNNHDNRSENIQLQSIFTKIFPDNNEIEDKYFYNIAPLSLDNIFPQKNIPDQKSNLETSKKEFIDELEKIKNEEQLYYLLQKYLWSFPAQTAADSDISLFDHVKTTAALTLSLSEQYQAGELTSGQLEQMTEIREKQFLLLSGDLSGIQDFIFNIPTRKASKSLKGRSIYLELITEIVVRYILNSLSLKKANLLYNGGGNFYILLPYYRSEELDKLRKSISQKILTAHQGDLYLALDYITISPAEFDNFSEHWQKVGEKLEKKKNRRWSELGLDENYNFVFGPLDNGVREDGFCNVCGISGEKRDITKLEDTEINICSLCASFIELTDKVKTARYFNVKRISQKPVEINNYQDIMANFGYTVDFTERKKEKGKNYLLNETDFLAQDCSGFKFGAYNLPVSGYRQITFTELAEKSIKNGIGDKKLGVVKLDIDNLGRIFGEGLRENRNIARISTLSRMMSLFFTGYINQIIKDNDWQQNIYPVFSGGDDTFVVGSWQSIFEFVEKFYNKFKDYTCHNKYLTFSASLGIFRYNYSISRMGETTEELLDHAKTPRKGISTKPVPYKNKISVLGEEFNWEEFGRIKSLKEILQELVLDKGYGRSLLRKVHNSTLGFKKILKDSTEGLFDNVRFWRLAYYLREVKQKDDEKAEEIINEYRDIVIKNLVQREEKKVKNIMLIPVAVRWTELATRKMKQKTKEA
ncbi:MAG: type III-A CRISPR-associated protein Cas10/Csm1 [bacterium]